MAFTKEKLKDVVGVRILESVTRLSSDDQTAAVLVCINGVPLIFEEDTNESGSECLGPRSPRPDEKAPTKTTDVGKVVRIDHRCTRESCDRGTCREHADVLYAIDKKTGKVVFEIGAEQVDDYGESTFVFEFSARGKTPDWMRS